LIILNSFFLGAIDYTDVDNVTKLNSFVEYYMEPFFTIAFLIECVSKIIAMGFFMDSRSYLSIAWN
jgi:hypothetical protein